MAEDPSYNSCLIMATRHSLGAQPIFVAISTYIHTSYITYTIRLPLRYTRQTVLQTPILYKEVSSTST